MSNRIKIKRGPGIPANGTLRAGELGFDTTNRELYIGTDDTDNSVAEKIGLGSDLFPLAIDKGGTDATTAEEALANLGVYDLHKSVKNYLDNSNFANPVNQRGKTQYAGYGFTIDRWYSSKSSCLLTLNDGFIRMEHNTASSATGARMLAQKIEAKGLTGKKMTLIAKVRGTRVALIVESLASTPYYEGSDWTTLCLSFTVPENTSELRFWITGDDNINNIWDCEWIALYEGEFTPETAPPYIPKDYAAELMECYRYFYKAHSHSAYAGYATSAAYAWIPLPVAMRAIPTVTIPSSGWMYSGGTRYRNGDISAVMLSGPMARISFTKPSDVPSYAGFTITMGENGVELSADL